MLWELSCKKRLWDDFEGWKKRYVDKKTKKYFPLVEIFGSGTLWDTCQAGVWCCFSDNCLTISLMLNFPGYPSSLYCSGGKVEWYQAQAGSKVWCRDDVSTLNLVRLCAGVKVGGGLNQYWQHVGKLHENSALLSNVRLLFCNFKRLARCSWQLLVTVTSQTSESVPTV